MAEARVPQQRGSTVPCRYFAKGKCTAGDKCHFSHQVRSPDEEEDPTKRFCVYFQQGSCKYGSNCMFKHQTSSGSSASSSSSDTLSNSLSSRSNTKSNLGSSSSSSLSSNNSSSSSVPVPTAESGPNNKKTGAKSKRETLVDSSSASTSISSSDCDSDSSKENLNPAGEEIRSVSKIRLNLDAPEFIPSYLLSPNNVKTEESLDSSAASSNVSAKSWAQVVSSTASAAVSSENEAESGGLPLLCPYAEMGDCPYGDACEYLHGEICEFCGLACLHPFSKELSKQHTSECIKQHEINMEHSMAIARSQDKVCGVCFETIMEKNPIREQRFGILPNCNHCFCLACIRKWRQAKQFESKIIRACPECRVTSDFVCPSAYWVDTKEDKDKLLDEYKQAMSAKQCKHFNQGKGKCPFGNKCFYLHATADGKKVDLGPPERRRLQDANGDVFILDESLLWDFVFDRDDGEWESDSILDDEEDLLEDLLLFTLVAEAVGNAQH